MVNFYSMLPVIIMTTIQEPDASTFYLIYSSLENSEVSVTTLVSWRKNRNTRKIMNRDSSQLFVLTICNHCAKGFSYINSLSPHIHFMKKVLH